MRSLSRRFTPLPYSACWAWASWQRAMGGGPRTFPGGVNKWQWKRMMVKRRVEREERRLEREKKVYKMRQRAEVLAAHPELQQPWEKLAISPPLGTSSEQQLTGLVGRFQKPSNAEDLWTQSDGPQRNHPEHAVDAHTNHQFFLLDAHTDAADATCRKDQVCTMQSQLRGTYQHAAKVSIVSKKKEVSPIGKSMQDYLDSFETDPLGLAVNSNTSTRTSTSTSTKEKHGDPLRLAGDSKASPKNRGVGKSR